MNHRWNFLPVLVAGILLLASCKDVPVDPETQNIIKNPSSDTAVVTPGTNPDTCADCVSSRTRSIVDLRQAFVHFSPTDQVNSPATGDSLEFDVKALPRSIKLSSAATAAPVLSFEVFADIPEILSEQNLNWKGLRARSLHINVPEIALVEGASVELYADPREHAGVMLSYRFAGGTDVLKEAMTGDKVEGNMSYGKARITKLDKQRRIVTSRIAVIFWIRDTSYTPNFRSVDLEMDLRFNY